MTSLLTTLQQLLLFAGSILTTGCVAWRLFVAPHVACTPGVDALLRPAEERVARVALASALVVVVAWLLRGVVQVMGFRDPFVPLRDDVGLLLFQTLWGTVWMVQGGIVLLLVTLLAFGARSDAAWRGAALLVLALAGTLTASGHAMGVDARRTVALVADSAHVLTAGLWIGTLSVILLVGRGGANEPTLLAAQLRRFSPLALASGLTLVAMGVLLAWIHLPTIADLWTSRYGRLIAGKAGLSFVVLSVGFLNWRHGLPVLDSVEGAEAVRRRAAAEVALAVGVLMLTAVLVHSSKP